jgi:predicted transcriptional regulator
MSVLKIKLAQLQVQQKDLSEQQRNVYSSLQKVNNEINQIQHEIEKQISSKPQISDHALLRYLERTEQINIEQLKDQLLTPKLVEIINTFHSGRFPISNDLQAIVKNNTITTIIYASQK